MPNRGQVSTPDDPAGSRLMEWIRDHLDYPHDYCLIWPFARGRHGYGSFGREGKQLYAHRYICEQVHGAPPTEGHQAAHSCGRGHDGCVNPRHLSWKTPSENQLERKPQLGRTKLTAEQALEIRSLKDKEHVTETAARFGVTENNVRQIQSGKIWRDGRKWQREFTPDDIARINSLRGVKSQKEIGAEYGVDDSCISRIHRGQTYKHLSH